MRRLLSFAYVLVLSFIGAPHHAYSQSAEYIFFSRELASMIGSSYIGRLNLDGSNATDIQSIASLGSNRPYGLGIDWKNKKLYYTTRGTNTIKRTNLDGSGLETVISSGLSDPIDLQVDSENGKIYWSEGNAAIKRANIDGTGVETIRTVTGLPGIALSVRDGKIFYGDYQNDVVGSMSLDGSNHSVIINGSINAPFGMAIDFENNKLFIASYIDGVIYRSNFDGSNLSAVTSTNVSSPNGVAINSFDDKVYWFNQGGAIYRANFDGSSVENVASTGSAFARRLVLDLDSDLDGVRNSSDLCPDDEDKSAPGQCGCGVSDTDTDLDGSANCVDSCPTDASKTSAGVCGCGVADTDSDSDGSANCVETCDDDPAKTAPGTCGCGAADNDTDSDGTLNCNDQCPSDSGKTAPLVCGCGVAETDSDGDGAKNCNDSCPNDSEKTAPLVCGCGTADTDTDENSIKDCLPQNGIYQKVKTLTGKVELFKFQKTYKKEKEVDSALKAIIASGKTLTGDNKTAILSKISKAKKKFQALLDAEKNGSNKKKFGKARDAFKASLQVIGADLVTMAP